MEVQPHVCLHSSAEMQLSSSVLFPPRLRLPIHARRFDEFLTEKKKEIRQKMAARPEHSLGRSQGNLTYWTFLPKHTEPERNIGQRAGRKNCRPLCRSFSHSARLYWTCVRVFIHRFPWKVSRTRVGPGGRLWVGCG